MEEQEKKLIINKPVLPMINNGEDTPKDLWELYQNIKDMIFNLEKNIIIEEEPNETSIN